MADDGSLITDQTPGEVVVKSDLVMAVYYKNPEETAACRRDGWHLTGDIGYRDADGYVYLVDRKRDMIISGGFNIFPNQVEKAVLSHPAVQDCGVVGVPDDLWGEAVKAIVELRAGQSVPAEELAAHCRARLGGYMVPKSFEFAEALPRSPAGKLLRRKLREKYWDGHDRRI